MKTDAYRIPEAARELLTSLWIALEQDRRLGDVLTEADHLTVARAWLERILTDLRAREVHTDWLCNAFHASFRASLPRRCYDGVPPPQPAADTGFLHHALPPEPHVAVIVRSGVQDLPAEEFGRLLLNPYAIWDIADRIDLDLPDYWLPHLDEAGANLSRELGIEIPLPEPA